MMPIIAPGVLCSRFGRATRSYPFQGHANISRHAARKVDDLHSELISARAELSVPELINLLGHAGQGRFPTRLVLIDSAAVIGADRIGKAIHLNLSKPVRYGAFDDSRHAL